MGLLVRNGVSSVKILSLLLEGGREGLQNFGFLCGSGFFSIGDELLFHGAFLVRSGFLSNNPPLGFAILKT